MKRLIHIFFLCFVTLGSCKGPDEQYQQAQNLYEGGKYDEALESVTNLINAYPDSAGYYSLRAILYGEKGRDQDEVNDLTRIIQLLNRVGKKSLNAHLMVAVLQNRLGFCGKALININYCINNRMGKETVKGEIANDYLNKGSILYNLKDFEGSKENYQLAISKNMGKEASIEPQALVGLANLAKTPAEALILLKQSIKLDGKNYSAFGARAGIELALGKVAEAYLDYQKAHSLNPNDPILNYDMGQLFLINLNNDDSAAFYFQKTVETAPQLASSAVAYMNLGVINQKKGDNNAAMNSFEKAREINPTNDLIFYNYSMFLSGLQQNEEALENIEHAIKINPKDPDYYNLMGTIQMDLFHTSKAEESFKMALSINPQHENAKANLLELLSRSK